MQFNSLRAAALVSVALALGGAASTVMAKTYAYTFGSPSGGVFCDGLTLSSTGAGVYSGFHLNYDCDQDNLVGGGFQIKNDVYGNVIEFVAAVPPGEPDVAQTFYLDIKHKTFYLYQIGGLFNVYTEIASGTLIKGAPPVTTRGGVSALHPRAGAKIEPMPAF